MLHITYIAFGSNLENPQAQIKAAIQAIGQLGHVIASPLYASKAIGPGQQPDYINGVIELKTELEPLALLRKLQQIELDQGRIRSVKNAARTLDLDILLYDQLIQDDPILTLPHPRMHERNFVLFPLAELSSELEIPKHGKISELLPHLSNNGLKKLDITL